MLMKPCPKCGTLYSYGKPYCPKCMPIYEANKVGYKAKNQKNYDEKRKDSRERKFYKSKKWQTLATATMARRGYKCERCGAWGRQVHHKIPIQTPEGWNRRFDPSNLELLCIRCHNIEHNRERPKRRVEKNGKI